MKMFLNGYLIDESKASLPVLDHGLLYGVGVFETFRTYQGYLFLIHDHLERLHYACDQLHIKSPYSYFEWVGQVGELLYANEMPDAMVRIAITGGVKNLGLGDVDYNEANALIFVRPVHAQKGKKAKILQTPRQAPGGVENLKTNNYLNHIIARQEIKDYPSTEGIFLTREGVVAEGITSNLFFVKNGELYTPSLELGILPGITRKFVLMLAQKQGYTVHEGKYTVDDLANAEEIFFTNSVQEIISVIQFEGRKMAEATLIATELRREYANYVSSLWGLNNWGKVTNV